MEGPPDLKSRKAGDLTRTVTNGSYGSSTVAADGRKSSVRNWPETGQAVSRMIGVIAISSDCLVARRDFIVRSEFVVCAS